MTKQTKTKRILIILGALALLGAITGGGLYLAFPNQMSTVVGLSRNYWLTFSAPSGTLSTELNPAYNSSVGDVVSAPGAATAGNNLFSDSVVVLDARTGDYRHHYQVVPKDWHDWDVSNPPVLIQTTGVVAPKDGHLYAFNLKDNSRLYRVPVTRIENVDVPFAVNKPVHFALAPWAAMSGTAPRTFRRLT